MKCPKCGTYNGKTNKFCRECGLHLSWVVEDDNIQAEIANDEVALGEKLAEIYDCYESGDLDAALAGAEKVVRDNPSSTSAHGVLALIYERKGEMELEGNNPEAARGFLELAFASYEKIVTLNPGSEADREKLAVLRMKLKGKKKRTPTVRRQFARLKTAITSTSPQVLAAGITFIVILVLAIVLLPAKNKAAVKEPVRYTAGRYPETSASNNSFNSTSPGSSSTPSSGLKIYTFPAPTNSSMPTPPTPVSTLTHPSNAQPQADVKPAKLPPITSELTIAPESKKQEKASAKVEPVEPKKSTAKTAAAEPKDDNTPRVDGTSLLANAIQLRNQGRTADAIATAQLAINKFQSEVSSGNNPTSAQRGIENARKLISLWQQSGN